MAPSGPDANDLLARFDEAVCRDPGRLAVRDTAGALTFAEVDRDSARLAAVLGDEGVRRGDPVGVCLGRDARLVVVLLAVWRAGAAYVPLDPGHPADRLGFTASDAGIRALVADDVPDWCPAGVAIVAPSAVREAAGPGRYPEPLPHQPAYVIYTSGTTGRPKGVQATRDGVASLVAALERQGVYAAEPRVVAWNAGVSFDASVQQWARVCRGDTVVILDEDHRRDPASFAAWLDECAATDVDLTPSHWEALREHLTARRPDGRVLRLFIGGEPIAEHAWREITAAVADGRVEALNLYGPTECTVDTTVAWIDGPRPTIGEALPENRLHVLDDGLKPVADGDVGELYVAGPRLANGYHGRPGLTARAFVADPFGPAGTRMYRTGDLVRRAADGSFEFAGRVDRQVKVRGYRVEPAEVEAAIRTHPAVSTAVVVVRDDAHAGRRLAAYYVVAGADGPTAAELRRHAEAALPAYMVPGAFTRIDGLPLTPNGKLDVEALPAPHDQGADDDTGRPPAGPFEELIAGVWSEVLGRDRVGADDDFFALGGHSLIALRVVARLKKHLGLAMSTKEVYRHPRLSDLARHVESLQSAATSG
ncbi:non-ribosomal peptide synthetase [Actinosynnema sp. NPDC020468]|uniref:non-ribosomal peptide synthetase n=1 Tax=Actinosynnema sp. NPDC020468 TaxID=3154488 RepID=UPI0033C4B2AB